MFPDTTVGLLEHIMNNNACIGAMALDAKIRGSPWKDGNMRHSNDTQICRR